MHQQLLLQLVSIILILARIDIPASISRTIDTVVFLVTNEVCPVVLSDIGPISLLPGLVLDFSGVGNLSKCWQYSFVLVSAVLNNE